MSTAEVNGELRILNRVFEEDWRSLGFRAAAVPGRKHRSYTWKCATWLNQGREGSCVGHGFAHELAARPVVRTVNSEMAVHFYREAQKIDSWPGESPTYEGTSVLAGAQVLTREGFFGEYRWALTMEDLIDTVGYRGPIVVGVNWYQGMFRPDSAGFIHVTGNVAGGHCLLVNGQKVIRTADGSTDYEKSYFKMHNSWGKGWGLGGSCFVSFTDMARLMEEQGDFCVPTVRK